VSYSLPDFIVIGAMKCATSSLHTQLAQNGCFMSSQKEPCYFSDDSIFAHGSEWYSSLFAAAAPHQLSGESSTHYTKLPTYPLTVERMHRMLPDVRLIYIVRDPIDRVVSHYIHEWSERAISTSLDDTVRTVPRLIDYSRYATQLRPYLDAFGPEQLLVVFFERMKQESQEQLQRVAQFIGLNSQVHWREDVVQNASSERLRLSPTLRHLLFHPAVSSIRRTLVPKAWREHVKTRVRMTERPVLSAASRQWLTEQLDEDIQAFGRLLGLHRLTCANFRDIAQSTANPRLIGSQTTDGVPL